MPKNMLSLLIIITFMTLILVVQGVSYESMGSQAIEPSPPKNLTARLTTINGNVAVVLEWEASSAPTSYPVTEYRIYRGNSSGNESFYDKVGGDTTSYVDYGVVNGKKYYYYVTAVNDVGESGKSNEVNITVVMEERPYPPRNLRAVWMGNMFI